MASSWQLQEAKNRLSEVVVRALAEGPQTISRRGKDVVVVMSVHEFQKLQKPSTPLVDFLRALPFRGVELSLKRSKDRFRKVDL